MEHHPVGSPNRNRAFAVACGTLGAAIATAGICLGEADDAPGAALLGLLLAIGLLVLAVKIARRQG